MNKNIKWKTIVALIMVYSSVVFNQMWLLGLLFLFWTIESLRNRRAYVIEDIKRDDNPILYWVIVTTWFILGLFYFDFFNELLINISS